MAISTLNKDPDAIAWYHWNWVDVLAPPVMRDQWYFVGQVVQPPIPNGYLYECTATGTTESVAPQKWPKTLGETIQDGSATWTCRTLETAPVPAITSYDFEVPAGITEEDRGEDAAGRRTRIKLSGGTAGKSYDVVGRITSSGETFDQTLRISVAEA